MLSREYLLEQRAKTVFAMGNSCLDNGTLAYLRQRLALIDSKLTSTK
jgi:hypothetical protein